jgi:hypothetical protein
MWYHHCGHNNHKISDFRSIVISKMIRRLALKPKLILERSLWLFFLFEEISELKRQLKPEKSSSNKKKNKENLLILKP